MKGAGRNERRHEAPAESAGQLGWLIAAVLLVTLPHVPHVHPWVPVMVGALAAWRFHLAWRRKPLPGIWLRVPLTLAAFAGIVATYRQISGVDAGSSLLLVMVAMKLLETRGYRDRAVVVFICYFLLFATFLREQALWSLPYLTLAILVATTALLQTSRRDEPTPAGTALRLSGRLLIQALPLAALLFLLFPRVPGPFWSLPQQSSAASSGLSDSMSPGDITQLALSEAVAFRVRFDGEPPAAVDLYWRGPVLERFDGRRWSMRTPGFNPGLLRQVQRDRAEIRYEITLEAHRRHWLLALETPLSWSADRATLTSTFTLGSFAPVDRRLSYTATSVPGGRIPGSMPPAMREAALWLPPGSNPRSRDWARQLRDRSASDREFIDRVLAAFREQPFVYSLTPPRLGEAAVDDFLFNTREGFCGHYASAFAVLARAAGVPSRVVTGYQGAERNPLGNYWIVRQANAHAWTEVWLDGRWERVDPTAAVAPERIEGGMDEVIERGRVAGAAGLRGSALMERLALGWDAVNAAWNRWVLAFGPDSQLALLQTLGIGDPALRHLLVATAAGTSLCLIGIWWWQQRRLQQPPDPLGRLYALLCRRTARVTRPRQANETAAEYAHAAARQRPDLSAELLRLFDTYSKLRYEGAGGLDRFAAEVRAFHPAPAAAAPAPPRPPYR